MSTPPSSQPESWQVSLTVAKDDRLAAEAAIEAIEPLAQTSFECTDGWRIECFMADQPDARQLQQKLNFGELEIVPVMANDWVRESLRDLDPIIAGRFYVYGSHVNAPPPAGKIPLKINAGTAFGTGHHGTTAGCLDALSLMAKSARPFNVLDLGCGTGLLGIAAAKLWPADITLSDIDPDATAFARIAAKQNALPRLRIITAPGLEHYELKAHAPYDLIIANILARPLRQLAPAIAGALADGGTLILSGLLHEQAAGVLAAYRPFGLSRHRQIKRDEWSTLILKGI